MQNIKKAFQDKQIIWRQHALVRMMERGITRHDISTAIQYGKIIESYPETKPHPGLLISGKSGQKMIHVVLAWDETAQMAYVITAYIPDLDHFEKNGLTRKKGRVK